jgi:hypothetical protein
MVMNLIYSKTAVNCWLTQFGIMMNPVVYVIATLFPLDFAEFKSF